MWTDQVLFLDRHQAGQRLADQLQTEPLIRAATPAELLVLSIPRGGVVVGAAIAQALGCAHAVVVVKKISLPDQEELAIGAMAENGPVSLNEQLPSYYHEKALYLPQVIARLKPQIAASIQKFRQGRPLDLPGKVVIVVDDGIATGETMKAVLKWLTTLERAERPTKVIVAVPVCAPRIAPAIRRLVDKFICLALPQQFWAVGQFYRNFAQVSEAEVIEHLAQSTPVHATT